MIAGALAAPAAAADGVIGTWMSGAGPSAKTYVLQPVVFQFSADVF